MNANKNRSPLSGIRVLDFSRLFAGPQATMTLADLGAEVIKVEAPTGDDARRFGPPFLGGEGMNFMALNRGKRSITIDLKSETGRVVAQRLAKNVDVVVENFRPGVTERLGIDYKTLSADNPGLIYCSVSGFGEEGENKDRPALDIVLQAMTGVMDRQGKGGPPELLVITIADTYAASLAVQSVLAALLARARDGEGQRVEVTLFEALVAAQSYRIISPSEETMLPGFDDTVPYQAFEGSDGSWFVIACVSPRNWEDLCAALDRRDLAEDMRFQSNPDRVQNRAALIPKLTVEFRKKTTAEWLTQLSSFGVPVGPVRRVEDVIEDPWCIGRGLVVEAEHPRAGRIRTMGSALHLSRTPVSVAGRAPVLGEHTEEILLAAGFSPREIQDLLAAGVITTADRSKEETP
jgi:crotonobetainyl-CoA:carnitine CoA-transferase CaiB-like acyl-CoA transferase